MQIEEAALACTTKANTIRDYGCSDENHRSVAAIFHGRISLRLQGLALLDQHGCILVIII